MEWDPIGVSGISETADEYDCMLSPILHRLHDGVGEEAIRDWIVGEVEGHFEMQSDLAREGLLARRIGELVAMIVVRDRLLGIAIRASTPQGARRGSSRPQRERESSIYLTLFLPAKWSRTRTLVRDLMATSDTSLQRTAIPEPRNSLTRMRNSAMKSAI